MGSRRSVQRCHVLAAIGVLASLWSIGPARASIMRYLAVEDLARSSTLVARVRVLSSESRWTEGQLGIVTEVHAVVIGALASRGAKPADGRQLTILQAGGEVDGIRLDWVGRPTFSPGEDLVLFLQPNNPADPADERLIVVGGRQGRMRVVPEAGAGPAALMVEQDLFGVLDAPHFEGVEPSGPGKRRDRIAFDELKRRALTVGGLR